MPCNITITPLGDLAALEVRWRALEALADPGVFRSWTWLGCLAEQRLPGARLLAATESGDDLALALLGCRGRTRLLNETGDPAMDAIFIEHNGLLVRKGAQACIAPALRLALRHGSALVLSGIDDAHLDAARTQGRVRLHQTRLAPTIDLAALRGPYLDTLSANARAQIRRAHRLYGPGLALRRAASAGDALGIFETLVRLHQAAWTARGKPGAFADPATCRFHEAFIARAHSRGEADLLEMTAEGKTVGALYNLVAGGHVQCYQSGFAYERDARQKPGLVAHTMAIEMYAAEGRTLYDLLGGAGRYKTTLAGPGGIPLHWATLRGRWSPRGLAEAIIPGLG